MNDAFGDRMKKYEMAEAGRTLMTDRIPVIARLDGRSFSTYTLGLERPFDPRLSELMAQTATALLVESGAACAYTQSDEITLGWYVTDPKTEFWFGGRIQKLVSVLAGTAANEFNRRAVDLLPGKGRLRPATFDCRVWNVPNTDEGVNSFLWREHDCTKNSISMAARCYYSHAQLNNRTGSEMQELLHAKGVNWNDYPAYFKRGRYIRIEVITRKYTPDELAVLPEKHAARTNPDLVVTRSEPVRLDLPPLTKIENRFEVLFLGHAPRLYPT